MPAQAFTMNPNYLAMICRVRELHQVVASGRDDSPEADAIRDASDGPWLTLSEIEKERIRNLSDDLFSLTESVAGPRETNPQAHSKLLEAIEARKQGDWDRALALLRRWGSFIDAALVSYLRGSIWLEAGDSATAALFFEHSAKLQPTNGNYRAMHLYALNLANPDAALHLADGIVRDADQTPPVVVTRAAEIVFRRASRDSEPEASEFYKRMVPILESTLKRFEQDDPTAVDRSSYITTIALLGFAHERLGKLQVALDCYSRGLTVDPYNDALLVARGMVLYGTSPRAIWDFETAIQYGSSVIWPYFFVAHDHLINHRFEQCRIFCERALAMNGTNAMKSELSEWSAIAQAELRFPTDLIRASFESAIRLDPSNERARHNLDAFEAALRPAPWETRSSAAVRTSGLVEHGCAIAA